MTGSHASLARKGLLGGGAQGLSSLSNAGVAAVVAHELGARSLGQFGLLFTVMSLFVAAQTAWVGDSLVVMDTTDATVRRGIVSSQWLHSLVVVLIAPVIAFMTAGVSASTALEFGLLTALWQLEEYGRRALMARLEFGRQLIGDATYLVVTFGAVFAAIAAKHLDLRTILGAMLLGSLVSYLVEMRLLPAESRLSAPRLTRAGLADVSRFGVWRSAQTTTGYIGQAAFRYVVIGFGSFAALGSIEAARLMVAPLLTLLAASANVLLPFITRAGDEAKRLRIAGVTIAVLLAVSAVYGAILVIGRRVFTSIITGGNVPVSAAATSGWLLAAAATAIATPLSLVWLARKRSRVVFVSRVLGAVAGFAAALVACLVGAVSEAPFGLAFGNAVSAAMLARPRALGVQISPEPFAPSAARPSGGAT